ncbi:MAG: hypothetical protein U9N86_10715 [Bacteroidota bacterium]|nr:hypothetical protein [Bacteroidota bacterium]
MNNIASWSSPANIALIKYWGKKDVQLPANSSLSMTLDESRTVTEIEMETKSARAGSGGGGGYFILLSTEPKQIPDNIIRSGFSIIPL